MARSAQRSARSGGSGPESERALELTRIAEIARASIHLSQLAPGLAELSADMAAGARSQAEIARSIADDAVVLAGELESAISSLKLSSASIGSIVHLIRKLADQSKILALNAAIEAAKAGRAGNAFGAVAAEVESLAVRTSSATSDVGEKVAHIEASIAQAVATAGLGDAPVRSEGAVEDAAGRNLIGVRGIGDKVLSIAAVAEQHSAASARVADTGRSVRALCDRLLLSVGVFRLPAHHRAAAIFDRIAGQEVLRGSDRAAIEDALRRASSSIPMIDLLYFTDAGGVQITRNIWGDGRSDGRDAIGRDWRARTWFQQAVDNARAGTVISDIYRSAADDRYCFTVSKAVFDRDGALRGVLAGDIDFATLLDG